MMDIYLNEFLTKEIKKNDVGTFDWDFFTQSVATRWQNIAYCRVNRNLTLSNTIPLAGIKRVMK
jgi:hypothetical protein